MDIAETIRSLNVFDLLVFLFLFAMFILGFMQGTIRRLLGIGSILFSFLLATQIREPLGQFLASNWPYNADYSYMIGYAAVFVAASLAFTIVLQAFYKSQQLFPDHPSLDEVLGGILGVVQGLVVLIAVIMILDPFFQLPGIPISANEFPLIRDFHQALDGSATATVIRQAVIPSILAVAGAFFPDAVKAVFPNFN